MASARFRGSAVIYQSTAKLLATQATNTEKAPAVGLVSSVTKSCILCMCVDTIPRNSGHDGVSCW